MEDNEHVEEAFDEDGEGKDEIDAMWNMLSENQKDDLKKIWEKTEDKVNYIG